MKGELSPGGCQGHVIVLYALGRNGTHGEQCPQHMQIRSSQVRIGGVSWQVRHQREQLGFWSEHLGELGWDGCSRASVSVGGSWKLSLGSRVGVARAMGAWWTRPELLSPQGSQLGGPGMGRPHHHIEFPRRRGMGRG